VYFITVHSGIFMRLMLAHKLVLSAVILIVVSAGIVGSLFYYKTTALLVQHAVKDLTTKTYNTGAHIQAHIDDLQNDVLFLIDTPPVQGMLRARKTVNQYDEQDSSSFQQWQRRLESIFVTMLNSKRSYLNIRIIDQKGREQIAVRRHGDKVLILKGKQLQNKAHRDYVRDTMKLSAGSIFLSEFNLNREHGEIEVPHRQVLRSATPIYDHETGNVTGLLIITAEFGHELQEIQNQIQGQNNRIYITNDHGGYLLHPDPDKAYGFNLGKRYRIQEDFPELAMLFLPANQDKGIMLLPEDTGGKNVMNFIKMSFDPLHPQRFIAVGITKPYSEVVSEELGVLNNVVFMAAIMILIVIVLAMLYAYRLSRPINQMIKAMDDYTHGRESHIGMPVNQKDEIGLLARSYEALITQVEEAQANLEEMNLDLELKVQERTRHMQIARDEAQCANAAKSEFLSCMSHELRTPMNAILGFGQVLQLDEDILNEDQRTNVKEILDAGHHLLGLINEVLDLSKIESGKLEVSMQAVSVDEQLKQCITMMQSQIDFCQLKMVDKISGKGQVVQADASRLKQVLLNLLSNAVKYNCCQGSITLSSEVMEDNKLRINITDTGGGLTDAEIGRLFTPFERMESANNIEGTGIGLVISKHLVELMGGSIGVNSIHGEGSTFWLELNIAQLRQEQV